MSTGKGFEFVSFVCVSCVCVFTTVHLPPHANKQCALELFSVCVHVCLCICLSVCVCARALDRHQCPYVDAGLQTL